MHFELHFLILCYNTTMENELQVSNEKVTIAEALSRATMALAESGTENASLDCRVILGDIIKKDSLYLHTHSDEYLSEDEIQKFNIAISERLNKRPVAYIMGKKEFYGYDFFVTEDVLIPRADTEILVENAIEYAKSLNKTEIRILDLCCGSGAIGLTLAKELENSMVMLSDISEDAINICIKNAKALDVSNCEIIASDLFEELDDMYFDIIVSNPPYITSDEMNVLSEDIILWEPHEALYGGQDGLNFYREISSEARQHLNSNGILMFEIGAYQAMDVTHIMQNCEYKNIQTKKDLAGLDRVVFGKYE